MAVSAVLDGSGLSNEAETERRLLELVCTMAREHGLASLRIIDISKKSGLSVGWIYRRFDGREGLVRAALASEISTTFLTGFHDAMVESVLDRSEDFGEFIDGLREVLRDLSSSAYRDTRIDYVRRLGNAVSRPEVLRQNSAAESQSLARGEAMVRAAQERGWVGERFSARTVALLIQALVVGRVLGDIGEVDGLDDEWAELVEFLMMGLVKDAVTAQ